MRQGKSLRRFRTREHTRPVNSLLHLLGYMLRARKQNDFRYRNRFAVFSYLSFHDIFFDFFSHLISVLALAKLHSLRGPGKAMVLVWHG